MRGFLNLTIPLVALALSGCAPLKAFIEQATVAGPPARAPDTTGRTARAGAPPPPIFGDWWYTSDPSMTRIKKPRAGDPCLAVPRFSYPDVYTYVPVNVPGADHGGPSFVQNGYKNWFARCYTESIAASGAPVAVLIRERNCPFPYATAGNAVSPNEVPALLDTVSRLDYLFMDLEPIRGGTEEDIVRNVEAIVRMVRSHPNPRVSGAFIGNYNDWPGLRNEGQIWPDQRRDRTRVRGRWDRNRFYLDNLNVAMPIAYPYEVYSRHSDAGVQKGPTTPNDRAAAFWAPVERVSVAARNLPEGHLLIPWVSTFIAYTGDSDAYRAEPPPERDMEALIRHLRLRGAHSFMVWTHTADRTDHPRVNRDRYKQLAMNAWRTLDPAFPGAAKPEPLNLEDDKSSGIVWSGVVSGGRAWVLVSNLGDQPRSIELPSIPGVPARTPEVPAGEHRLFRWSTGG